MSISSPASVLYSSDGYELAVVESAIIPTFTRGLLVAGSDGTDSRFILVDTSARQVVVGPGTAGSQTGGVITIQGDPAGTPVPISGTVVATNPSVGTNNASAPASSTQIGGSDGTNLQASRAFDLDTGGGTEYNIGISIRLPSSGGSVAGGTGTNPIRIDPTGTTTQPVSGTVTANAGTGNFTVVQSTPANLRTQTASESTTATSTGTVANLIGGAVTTAAPTYTTGQMDPLSLTTAGALRIDGSGSTQPVSGTVTANAGTGNFTVVQATAANLNATVIGTTNAGSGASTGLITVQGNASGTPIPVTGFVTTNKATSSAVTSVASSTSNTSILASNANRIAATVFNGSNKIMYVKYGTTASTSSFSVQLLPNSYFEVQNDWTGAIDAVWGNGTSGNALVTELT